MAFKHIFIAVAIIAALQGIVTAQPRMQLPTRIPQTDASDSTLQISSPNTYSPSGTYAPPYNGTPYPAPSYGSAPPTYTPNSPPLDPYSSSQAPLGSSTYGPGYGSGAAVTRPPPPYSQGSPYVGAPNQFGQTAAPPYGQYSQPYGQPYTPSPYGQPYGSPPVNAPYYSPTGPDTLYPNGVFPNGPPQLNYSNEWTRLIKSISLTHTWIAGGDGIKDLGVNDTEVKATFDVPLFQFPDHFLVTPGFALHLWDGGINVGPGSTDLPSRTYDAFIDTAWNPKFTNWFSADLGVRVGAYTDFNHFATDSIRVLGRGLGVVNIQPNLQFKLGVLYIDRDDIKLLPAGGIIWDPSPDQHWEIFFPRPKIARRLSTINNHDLWMYVSGEYGGDSWTIVRDAGFDDSFDYNDIRAIFGLEWLPDNQNDWRAFVEVGYVFDRKLFYVSQDPPSPVDLPSTFMIRAGFAF